LLRLFDWAAPSLFLKLEGFAAHMVSSGSRTTTKELLKIISNNIYYLF
jgi:hypothetical protein